jgi:hypothetical protein
MTINQFDEAAAADSAPEILPPCSKPVAERLMHYGLDGHQHGDVLILDGHHFRATRQMFGAHRMTRTGSAPLVWKQCDPVSIQQYRRIRRTAIAWWIAFTVAPVAALASALLLPVSMYAAVVLVLAFLALFVIATIKVGALEKARSGIVAVFCEESQEPISPVSRGSRAGTDYFGDLALPFAAAA